MKEISIDSTAVIDPSATVGAGTWIGANVRIGDRTKVQNDVSLFEGVELAEGVFVGPQVCFTNDKIPRSINPDGTQKQASDWKISETKVGKGASLGANATIVCGIRIGNWAMIGSGAVVTKDVPDYGLAIGNPATLHGYVCRCGHRISNKPCPACGTAAPTSCEQ
jgi:acetyltransferase-like isoleucine patch superfamily enzyme